ncbi:MAG: hypothetical protein KC731_08835 [Myxococcales bacterium]|nr:hypothetical protein [Myxococcales bacterium]
MGIRLIGMTPPEVARTCYALDALERHLPDEHAHVCRALQYIAISWAWGLPPSVRAYTGAWWGRGMVLVQRPTAMSIEDLAVCVAHEARHIVVLPDGGHRYREHVFGSRPPTPEERSADPIYARDDEVRRVLSAGLLRESAHDATPPSPVPSRQPPTAAWPFLPPPWMRP